MASTNNYDYNFPYFPPHNPHSPPKIPPSHNSPTPPNKPIVTPPPPKFPTPSSAPPPRHSLSPPPPAAQPPKHSTPPPPSHPTYPPTPSHPTYPPTPSHPKYPPPPPFHPIHPPPPPHIAPIPSPPGHHSHTVIVVIFVSLGGVFFLAFLSVALCCFLKKKKKTVQETDVVKIDEHLKIKEAIIPGPHGPQTVILSVEDDIDIQEEIRKNETSVGKGGSHITSAQSPQVLDLKPSTSGGSPHHHIDQKTA